MCTKKDPICCSFNEIFNNTIKSIEQHYCVTITKDLSPNIQTNSKMPIYCPPTTTTTGTYAGTTATPTGEQTGTGSMVTSILISILVILVVIFIQALIVMLLWNWIIPRIWIGAPQIGFGTAFGLVLLIDVLSGIWAKPFGSFMYTK